MEHLRSDVLDVALLPGLGGRCHGVRAYGHELLRTPARSPSVDDDPFFCGWYPLVPWTNRVPGGRLCWRGDVIALPPNYGDGSALHGHAYAAPWTVVGAHEYEFRHEPDEFPWAYSARQQWAVDGTTLRQVLSVTNESDEEMPAGLGIHPWWVADGGLELDVPCRAAFHCEGGLAIGEPHRTAPLAGPVPWGTDQLFTDLESNEVTLRWPGKGLRATLRFSSTAPHLHLAAFRRVDAVAVEPVTHAGDGHGRLERGEPGAIDVLAPGATLSVTYELTVASGP